MWNPFKKRNRDSIDFKLLEEYSDKTKYLVRIQPWDWLDEKQIYIPKKDKEGKISMNTLDFWLQEIFLDSTGDKSVNEIFEAMKKQYLDSKIPIPKELDKILIDTIKTLAIDLKYIELHDKPVSLKEEILLPISKQMK